MVPGELAKQLSWKGVAESFGTTWQNVFRSVKHAVSWGLEHRDLEGIEAIGVDEVQWQLVRTLSGGRGTVIGSVSGALLIESVRNGLNMVDANPYVYPLVTGGIIFVAVLLDSLRHRR